MIYVYQRRWIFHLLMMCLLFILSGNIHKLSAEFVFLKDGSIITGKTVKVNDDSIEVEIPDGKSRIIQRRDILRTVFDDGYRRLRYIYLIDGSEIQAYIVYEDSLNYTCRIALDSPVEMKVSKNNIKIISLDRIDPYRGRALTPEEELRSRAALLRISTGLQGLSGSEFDSGNESMIPPLCIDLCFYRMRNEHGNGTDLFARYTFNRYDSGNMTEDTDYIYDMYGITITPSGITIDSVSWYRNSFAGGLRYVHDFYYNGILWQWYVLGYYQFSRVNLQISAASMEKYYVYYSHGVTAGVGVEAAISPMLGLFAEFTWGYSPAFPAEANVEGDFLRFGAVLRVPDLM